MGVDDEDEVGWARGCSDGDVRDRSGGGNESGIYGLLPTV
jgi:hypothetical protein